MENYTIEDYQARELTSKEYSEISGGDKFTESVFRVVGYLSRKWSDLDWLSSSWVENPRAQR